MNASNPQMLFQQAIQAHQRGDLAQAELFYRQVLKTAPGHADASHMLGIIHAQQGRNDEALSLIGAALRAHPHDAGILTNYANVLTALGRFDDALAHHDRALAARPNDAEILNNRGSAFQALGRFEDAIASHTQALRLKGDFLDAFYNRGNALMKLGRNEEALAHFDRVLTVQPGHADAWNNMGNVLQVLKRHAEAVAAYDRALAVQPRFAAAWSNRGNALAALGRAQEALDSHDRALAIDPANAETHIHRGIVLRDLNRLDEALAANDRALALRPGYVDAISNRGMVLWHMGRNEDALEAYDQALAINPNLAVTWSNRGNALRNLRRTGEAMESFDRALALDPDYPEGHWNKSFARLQLQDFEAGLPLYEWRKKLPRPDGLRNFPQPVWTGREDLKGKTLFLYAEQGLGDTFQFFRYVAQVQALGAEVVIAVQNPLVAILQDATSARVIPMRDRPETFDYHAALMSLPLAFGTRVDTIPVATPYLRARPDLVERWARRLGPEGFKIGIAWQGNRAAAVDIGRPLPLPRFAELARLPGVRLISLQKNDGIEELAGLPDGMTVETLGDDFDSGPAFLDTAAVMQNMDLIITPCTSIAHLAGALARPTWVGLKYVPDWRWFLDRPDCPWYPGMRLFRQQTPGDWTPVFTGMRTALAELIRTA